MATAVAEPPPFLNEEVSRHALVWVTILRQPPDALPSAMRSILQRVAEGRRARRITFFRNGQRFGRGLRYALSPEKVRTLEALL
ncbi:hypothetical protein HPB48_015499 [Haemaphysalis longicornis]|uniref:Doublecortin domain-containing protein n=1 Tax=Haemaphysalis longicornis TaxID=44386 RepID=A0A9J6FI21_HAELO|nr:hypothetical protein HPB48_015499 [Haemaphysalis longicornis]